MKRGFALVAVLWLVAVLGGAALAAAAGTSDEVIAARNRMVHARARWAAEACLSIALARGTASIRDTSDVNLGRDAHCGWRFTAPSSRLNLSTATQSMIERLLAAASVAADSAGVVVDSILSRRAGRTLVNVREIPELPARIASLVTVDGAGRIDLLGAPREVLLTIPGMTDAAAEALLRRRGGGRSLGSLQELLGDLDPGSRQVLLASFAEAARVTVVGPPEWLLEAAGWINAPYPVPRAVIELTVVAAPNGFAILRRRMR